MKYFITIFLSLLCAAIAQAQGIVPIKLRQQTVSYQPVHFHITSVIDDRADTATIGIMRLGIANKQTLVTLQGGVADGINTFIKNNVRQHNSTTAVTVHITKLAVSEKSAGFKEEADVSIAIAYYLGDRQLVEYSGSSYQQTSADASPYVEKLIRSTLENSLKQFDSWVVDHPEALVAPSITVTVSMGTATQNADQIPYLQHPVLTLSDFQGRPNEMSIAAAETYSGIGVTYAMKSHDGQMVVDVVVTPYFDKYRSWCKPNARDARTLSHEQAHMDITAINTCKLLQALRTASYTQQNYQQVINQLEQDYLKSSDDEQTTYDGETHHGTIPAKQAEWKQRVNEELQQQSCYQH